MYTITVKNGIAWIVSKHTAKMFAICLSFSLDWIDMAGEKKTTKLWTQTSKCNEWFFNWNELLICDCEQLDRLHCTIISNDFNDRLNEQIKSYKWSIIKSLNQFTSILIVHRQLSDTHHLHFKWIEIGRFGCLDLTIIQSAVICGQTSIRVQWKLRIILYLKYNCSASTTTHQFHSISSRLIDQTVSVLYYLKCIVFLFASHPNLKMKSFCQKFYWTIERKICCKQETRSTKKWHTMSI